MSDDDIGQAYYNLGNDVIEPFLRVRGYDIETKYVRNAAGEEERRYEVTYRRRLGTFNTNGKALAEAFKMFAEQLANGE